MKTNIPNPLGPREHISAYNLPVPGRFGGYQILEFLGNGGMGDVYKAKHLEMDRVVAIKVLPQGLASRQFLDRFNAEALAISRLQHHNIVSIYDYGEIQYRRYIAMQYIEASTLAMAIKGKKLMDYSRILHLAKQVCRGIKYAHEKDVIHRDIKPGNIMLDGKDRAYLSDFGIAQTDQSARLTTTGMAMGTPEYMAPEQCEGKPLDQQCDIYSFGIVLYEMITGSPPFTGPNPVAIAYQQVHENPPPLSKIRPGVPPNLDQLVAKCLKKHKEERYQDAEELLLDMDRVPVERPSAQVAVSRLVEKLPPQKVVNRRKKERRKDGRWTLLYRSLAMVLLGSLVVFSLYLYRELQSVKSRVVEDSPHILAR